MQDFRAGSEFLFVMQMSSESITMSASPPDPAKVKKKALLLVKARQESDEDPDPNNFFPSGIENEIIFMELTGKTLSNLYASCQVRTISKKFCRGHTNGLFQFLESSL